MRGLAHYQIMRDAEYRRIALLSQEGSAIAFFAMTRGVFPKRNVSDCILKECGYGTTAPTISTAVSTVLPS